MSDDHRQDQGLPPALRTWGLIGFLLVAGFFLFTEHRAHLFGFLPYVLLLSCVLMHLFGHGHGWHNGGDIKPDRQDGNKSPAPSEHHNH